MTNHLATGTEAQSRDSAAQGALTSSAPLIPTQSPHPPLTLPANLPSEVADLVKSLPEPLQTAVIAALNTPDGVRLTMGNAKGGVMKTTLSVYIALILALTGEPVLLVDADETNKTCLKWQATAGDNWPGLVTVVGYAGSASGATMPKFVNDLMARGFKHLIIDVGPTDKGVLKMAWGLTKKGIVPTQQYVGDVVQLTTTFALLAEMGEPVDLKVVLARTFPNRTSYGRAQDYVRGLIGGASPDHPNGLPTVTLLDGTVPHLEGIAETWGDIPDDFGHFASVLAEALGVDSTEIASRIKAEDDAHAGVR
ncbi:AAA family ATPase [Streptomyces sp. NPDC003038]|uniref:AAA family ATPase n=1 Tax=unclassified Streptomyces TaxID=2593676 RepID=UPI0033A8F221